MPETRALYEVRDLARRRKDGQGYVERLTGELYVAMRKARDEATLAKLAEASGLSIAQVQRICDLSKDRSDLRACGHRVPESEQECLRCALDRSKGGEKS